MITSEGVIGAGLIYDGKLLHLSVFKSEEKNRRDPEFRTRMAGPRRRMRDINIYFD